MAFADDILFVFDDVLPEFEATAIHNGNTYKCAKAYYHGVEVNMMNAGYDPQTTDLTITLRISDIVGAAPALNDVVTVDGTDYVVSGQVIAQPAIVAIPLREI